MAYPHNTIPWESIVYASATGASHKLKGTCCQDSLSVRTGTTRAAPSLFAGISDGHGGEAYINSDRGSSYAVCAAGQIATRFMLDAGGNLKSRKRQFESVVRGHLKDVWVNQVLDSWNAHEYSRDTVRQHGATLLMALIYRNHIHLAQLGDGEIFSVDRNGRVSFLVEPEEGPITNVVTSLCGRHTERKWKFGCIPVRKTKFLMMSSDGLINSLSSTREYIRLAALIEDRLRHVPSGQFIDALPEWLREISGKGSGDDISVIALNMKSAVKESEKKHEIK